jgi:hypothetical protein
MVAITGAIFSALSASQRHHDASRLPIHFCDIMFFGLTNSPATFQMMMNTIFRVEVAQGWLSVYMDDLTIHTKPRDGETEEQHRK